MAYSYVQYVGNGSTVIYSVPFTYLSKTHVEVRVNNVLKTQGVDYTWTTSSTITFTTAPAAGVTVDIRRKTSPATRLVDFQDGSTLTQEVLDTDSNQNFFLSQEALDTVDQRLPLAFDGQWDANNRRIANVANPVNAQDAVTKTWAETAMSSQVAQATAQANSAAGSATNAANSAASAASSSTTATNQANAASTSATQAANSATNAASSAGAASSSATAAAASATTATNKANEASVSAASASSNATTAQNLLNSFRGTYYGALASDPTVDPNGNAPTVGDIYYNSSVGELRVFGGSVWAGGTAGTVSVNRLSGNGSTTAFTLPISPAGENNTQVYISGIYQQKDTYSLSGTTLTFSEAPEAGTDNIEVVTISSLSLGNTDSGLAAYTQGDTGAVQRNVQSKLREFVSAKDFGVVADGIADDTIALINAFNHCRSNNKTLRLEGTPVFKASSVPSGSKHSGTGGDYVYASSMVANGSVELLVQGKIGFDLAGVDRTVVQGLKVTTSGREMTENDQYNASPNLFSTDSGTKTSAVYRDLIVYHNVTDLTGAYRAGTTFRENGCSSVVFDNIKVSNSTIAVVVGNSSNIMIRNLFGYNIQTNMYLTYVTDYHVSNAHYINTKTQTDYWVARTASPAQTIAGMDNLLVEQGNRGTVVGLHTEYAIERACYIQSSNVHVSDCYALNCDGYKVVGNSYTSPTKNHYIQNCHVLVDDDWTSTRGRSNVYGITSYWSSEVHIYGCSVTNTVYGRNCIPAVVFIGRQDGGTVSNVYVKDCHATNALRLVMGAVSTLTAAQQAALTPAGSFIAQKNIIIEGCYLKADGFYVNASLYDHYDTGASADAVATYATENVKIYNNTVEYYSSAGWANWLFAVQNMSGCITSGNKVNYPFAGSFFSAAITRPYQNLQMNEQDLKHSLNIGTLIDRFAYLSLLKDSVLKFSLSDGAKQTNIEVKNYADGSLSSGLITATIFGKGYTQVNTSLDFAVEMKASGSFYLGKVVGGVKTDQLSTPPVGITLGTGLIAFRGDLQPTVLYSVTMTKV